MFKCTEKKFNKVGKVPTYFINNFELFEIFMLPLSLALESMVSLHLEMTI